MDWTYVLLRNQIQYTTYTYHALMRIAQEKPFLYILTTELFVSTLLNFCVKSKLETIFRWHIIVFHLFFIFFIFSAYFISWYS